MKRINVQTDIKPLSEFRKNMAEMIETVGKTGQPIVLTQRGKTVAVVMSPEEYEALAYRDEFVNAIREGEESLDRGEGIPHEEVVAWFDAQRAARDGLAKAEGESFSEEDFQRAIDRADQKMAARRKRKKNKDKKAS